MTQTRLRIDLLGGFRVAVDGVPVPDEVWHRRKPATLVKLLSLASGHRLHREQLMDLLWPELGADAAGANLRKTVHLARGAMDDVVAGAGSCITSDGDVVALGPNVTVDVDLFRSSLATARRTGDAADYRQAVEVYAGELLPADRYDDWASAPRRELHVELLGGLTELAAVLEAGGELEAATEVVRRLVTTEPTREESHVALMRLYALSGRRADALRQFELLTQLLEDELGTDPGPEAQRLHEEIRSRQADEPDWTAELWERVGDLRVVSGDHAGAAKAFGLALDTRAPDSTARLERKCAEAWLMQHRPDAAAPHLAAADELATDAAERARLLRAHAQHGWESGDIANAQTYAEQARDMALQHGTADDVAAAHEAIAIVAHFKGEWREGLASELERLASDTAGTAELGRVFDIHHCIGQYHLYGDGLADSVEEYARRILNRATEVGAVRAQAFAWCLLGETLLLQARWDEADGCLAQSCELHRSLDGRSGALPWQRRAELAACRGAYGDVDELLRTASGIATVSVMAAHMWGRIYATRAWTAVEMGDPESAVRSIQDAAAAAARYGDCPTCSALLNPVAAEAFALLDDQKAAREYANAAANVATYFSSSAWQAMADTASGSVALAEGDARGARRSFELAHERYEKAGQPFWAKRSERLASAVAV